MKESQHTEWKLRWRDEYLRWICGFANAEEGVLVIGRNDEGVAVGVKDAEKLLEVLPNKIRDVLGIVVDCRPGDRSGQGIDRNPCRTLSKPDQLQGRVPLS